MSLLQPTELAGYQYQLDMVQIALSKDPSNAALQQLVHDLQLLITLGSSGGSNTGSSSTTIGGNPTDKTAAPPQKSSTAPPQEWRVGQHVLAKWSGDQKWYEAVIDRIIQPPAAVAVAPGIVRPGITDGANHEVKSLSSSAVKYAITFTGYGNKETVRGNGLRLLPTPPSTIPPSLPLVMSTSKESASMSADIPLPVHVDKKLKTDIVEPLPSEPVHVSSAGPTSSAKPQHRPQSQRTKLEMESKLPPAKKESSKVKKEEMENKQKAWLTFAGKKKLGGGASRK